MNNKILLIIAIIIAIGAGWFFGKNTQIEPPIQIEKPKVEYEATDIKGVQTNEQGDTEYEFNAKSLSHNNETNKDALVDITMDWQPDKNKKYQLTAGLTELNQETGVMTMTKGFKIVSQQPSKKSLVNEVESNKKPEPIIIIGDTLTGNTKMKVVKTTKPIRFKQGNNQFTASGMVANLETGEYEFTGIEVVFTPSERKDEPLF